MILCCVQNCTVASSSAFWFSLYPSASTEEDVRAHQALSFVSFPLFPSFTDAHPDPFYTPGTPISASCHHWDEDKAGDDSGKKKKNDDKKDDLAGPWGVGPSDCDSPMSLVNITFDWLEKEWADKVDFVIWTGGESQL